jgi:hypothetical protein
MEISCGIAVISLDSAAVRICPNISSLSEDHALTMCKAVDFEAEWNALRRVFPSIAAMPLG